MKIALRLLSSLVLVSFLPAAGLAENLAAAAVTVVSLDRQGQPKRQGMGVVVAKTGIIATSAGILAQGQGGIVKTNSGTMHLIERVIYLDVFQDLALVKVAAEGLTTVPTAPPGHPPPLGKVLVGARKGKECVLCEAQVVKTHGFSPRLVLLKLEPAELAMEPGAPIFNPRGELVGMLHSFAEPAVNGSLIRFCLARNLAHFPGLKKIPGGGEERELPTIPWEDLNSAPALAFWEGVAASQRQDWQTARGKFTTALKSLGSLPEGFYGRAVARYHLADYEGAVKDLTEATKLLPGYALAFLWLGRTRERQGNTKLAQEAYHQAVSASPHLSEAWYSLGTMAYREGDLDQAQEYLEKAQDDFPQAAQRWWYLGMIAQARERSPAALEAFNRAIKLDPAFFQAYLDGGILLFQNLGRPKEAVAFLQEAIRLKPRHPQARYFLALAQLWSWNPAGAWEQYFALRELYPDLAADLAATLEKNYH
jgi:tetratricopeptide (TPR) repeat protein